MSRATVAGLELSLYRGEDYIGQGTHRVSALPNAAVVDITGWTIHVTVKETAADAEDPVLESEATLTAASQGQYSFTFAAEDTAEVEAKDYAIDIWRVNDGAKTTLAKGTLTVKQPVRTPA